MEDPFTELKARYKRLLKNDEDPLALKRDAENFWQKQKQKATIK
jgi:hypothetical protein